jgi:FkbM family methyltransferase
MRTSSNKSNFRTIFSALVDVGIAFGSPFLYRAIPKAKYYLIEPVPCCKPILEKLTKQLNAEAFNVAAGSEDGEISLFVHSDVSGSSSFKELDPRLQDGEAVTIPMRKLDSLIPADIRRPCLLKIDTQGAELNVIKGAERLLKSVDVAILEVSFHQFREGIPEIAEVINAMTAMGFRCYDILEGEYRKLDGALAQVDLAFVPENSSLRRERTFFKQKTS